MMARHQKVFEARSSSELKCLIQMFSFFFSKGGVQVCKEGRGGGPNLMPLVFFLLLKSFNKIVFTLLFKFVYILFIHIVILLIINDTNHCFDKN